MPFLRNMSVTVMNEGLLIVFTFFLLEWNLIILSNLLKKLWPNLIVCVYGRGGGFFQNCIYFMYISVLSLYFCVTTCMPISHRDQKKVLNPLRLEL